MAIIFQGSNVGQVEKSRSRVKHKMKADFSTRHLLKLIVSLQRMQQTTATLTTEASVVQHFTIHFYPNMVQK